ncbi:MAG: family 16 glycosylhydrolase [Verrucomicrobia bacterium]|jgi:beta-glucanase (GH16 family)|nr:family 16 glycosylhydrolase [Verrucomicrobiota bacterium]
MKKKWKANMVRTFRNAVLSLTLIAPTFCVADWQLVWNDEFDGTAVDPARWSFDIGNGCPNLCGWGNNELEYYTSRTENVHVTNGLLHIVARKEVPQYNGYDYTSAKLKTQGLFSKRYGRFEFRARLPQGQGYWPALWMMPLSSEYGGWAASGEIDVMENRGSTPNTVGGTLHYGGSWPANTYSGASYVLPGGGTVTDFHTYMLEWSTNSFKWYVDGVLYQTQTSWWSANGAYPAPFDKPFYLIMNLAVGGNYGGDPNGTTVFPGELQVDYVRVYDFVPAIPDAPTGLRVSPGSAKAFLSWDDTSGASSYNVKRATSSGGPYTTVASPASNSYTDTSLANCSTYYYVVSATNSLGESPDSGEQAASLGAFALGVNSGGVAAGQFAADAYVSGGTVGGMSSATIDTSGLVAPAPQAVYQAERYGNFTYTFTGLISGVNYKVRLHSAETYWSAVGQRRFNVFINGAQVLANFDIIAVAGAPNKAVIHEFTATASSGRIVVQYTTVTDNARASGIEILLPQPPAPSGLTATAGVSEATLQWNALAGASYNVKRSLASGGPFTPLFSGLATTNCTDPGLTNGVTYFYVVSAVSLGCEGPNSAPVSATPACSPPPAPTAGNNGPIWAGMTLNLTASTVPGATYGWTGPNGFSSSNQNPSIVNASTNDSGLFSVTAAIDGCISDPAMTAVTVNPPASVSIQPLDGAVLLSWPGGTLQSATDIGGPWDDVSGAVSPRTNPAATSQEFYRLRLQ